MWKYPYKTKPYQHQRDALNQSAEKVQWAYFMEMGTGKTKVTLDNIAYLFFQRKITSTLIIAPKSVYTVWETEIETHFPDQLKYKIYKWNLDKPGEYYKLNEYKDLRIFLINVEALSTKRGFNGCVDFLTKNKLNFVVLDESTTIKNKSAKRTKNILGLRQLSHIRRILTGSPITKSPLDLYTQCQFLSPELLGFGSYLAFRNRYAEMTDIPVGSGRFISVPKYYKRLEELETKLKFFSTRIRKDQCLDLKPKIRQKRYIELEGEHKKIYDRLRHSALAIVEDSTISFSNKLTEIVKLHQVCNGFTKDDEGKIIGLHKQKLNTLDEILEETGGKVIIWANYLYNIHEIKNFLINKYGPESTVCIFGEVSVMDRKDAVNRIQTDSKTRFLVGNPTTGGFGLTLTACTTVIYYSNSYNLEVRMQSEDRAHRMGQKESVLYIDIVAKNTLDEAIMKSLVNKGQIAAKTLGEEDLRAWLL
jgi:SNF2 family DNA or RNA helicase|tara:strand:+ start:6087 stop:7514 length:1428 start_codon:yes stop_codon:yes gene_type:complete